MYIPRQILQNLTNQAQKLTKQGARPFALTSLDRKELEALSSSQGLHDLSIEVLDTKNLDLDLVKQITDVHNSSLITQNTFDYKKDVYSRDDLNPIVILAKRGNEVVGFIDSFSTDEGVREIDYYAVNEKYRGQGIGTQMLSALEKQIKLQNKSVDKILLNCRANGVEKFYQKLGFVESEEVVGRFQNGDEMKEMTKYLI